MILYRSWNCRRKEKGTRVSLTLNREPSCYTRIGMTSRAENTTEHKLHREDIQDGIRIRQLTSSECYNVAAQPEPGGLLTQSFRPNFIPTESDVGSQNEHSSKFAS